MLISEFLPNPVGKDTDGEFIELFNDGLKSINLSGWKIKDASGKTFTFKNQILGSGRYLTLPYQTTKITLNNDAETLYLYDTKGVLIDKASFSGTAPEGKSFIHPAIGGGGQNNQFVLSSKPTPGKPNIFESPTSSAVAAEIVPNNSATIINASINSTGLLIGFFIALVLAGLSVFILKKLDFNSSSD